MNCPGTRPSILRRLWIVIALVAPVSLVTTPSHAGHAGAANCTHNHIDAAISVCAAAEIGVKKCGAGRKGTCQQVTEEIFGVSIPTCLCLTDKDEVVPLLLGRMERAVRVALDFQVAYPALDAVGQGAVACRQLGSAVQDIVQDEASLRALPRRVYDPKLLTKLDLVITGLPAVASVTSSATSTCSAAGVTLPTVPVTSLVTGLADTKDKILDSRSRLIDDSFSSDRALKENVAPVDRHEILARVGRLPIARWNYTAEGAAVQHVGPMAQDFHAAFGLGADDRRISAVDASGVGLASIQALYELSLAKDEKIAQLSRSLEQRAAEIEELRASGAALRAQVEMLLRRLDAAPTGTSSPSREAGLD
jgi:hypothetical protein